MGQTPSLKSLSDDELLRRLSDLVRQSRRVESDVVAHIGEVDARKLHAQAACSSMFDYCRQVLHLSEQEAYLRIFVARASRQHPMLLTMLCDGRLHLSGIARLTPFLTRANREALLKRATHKSKRQIEEMVAELEPRPDARPAIRKLPERGRAAQPARGLQLCPDRVSTASAELRPQEVMARYRRSGSRVSEPVVVYGVRLPTAQRLSSPGEEKQLNTQDKRRGSKEHGGEALFLPARPEALRKEAVRLALTHGREGHHADALVQSAGSA